MIVINYMKYKLIIFFILPLILWSCKQRAEKEKYVIQKGYKGVVYIFYNQQTSSPTIIDDDGFLLYNIPSNGILLTSNKPNDGWLSYPDVNQLFFYTNSNDSLQQLEYIDNTKNNNTNVSVYNMKRGSIGNIEYLSFTVGIQNTNYYGDLFESTIKRNEWLDSIITVNNIK